MHSARVCKKDVNIRALIVVLVVAPVDGRDRAGPRRDLGPDGSAHKRAALAPTTTSTATPSNRDICADSRFLFGSLLELYLLVGGA